MIQRIEVSGCGSYSSIPQVLNELRFVNCVYGANGAGKTTISRIIAGTLASSNCAVTWQNQHKQQTLVYNRDFVRDNFSESNKLKGIFTLGKQDIATQSQLAETQADCSTLLNQILQLRGTLEGADGTGGKRGDLVAIEDAFRDEC